MKNQQLHCKLLSGLLGLTIIHRSGGEWCWIHSSVFGSDTLYSMKKGSPSHEFFSLLNITEAHLSKKKKNNKKMKYKCVNKSSCCCAVCRFWVWIENWWHSVTHNCVRMSQSKQTKKRESKKQSCCNTVLSLYYLKKLGAREGFSEVIFPHIKHITIAIIGLEHHNIVSHTFKHVVFKASNLSTAVYCFTFIWQKY